MRMNERMKKALSALLCVSMLAQNAPVVAFAAREDCTHHAEHTQECGYVAAVEGKPCIHVHDTAVCGYVEEVKEELCACTETDENGALVHTEGCGYVAPVAGSDCTHGHEESCGYVAAVEGRECTYRCEICLGNDDEEEQEQETTAPSEPETTEAAEEVEPLEPIELHQTVTIPLELDAAEFDNDEAFAAYVERLFYGDSGVSTFGPLAGIRLQGAERVIYDRMKVHVAAIAAGTQPADFKISSDDLDVSITLAQTEIGTDIFVQDGETLSITEEAQKELLSRFFNTVKVQQVLYALLSDCPYDLYWFDKASADILCEMGAAQDENGALYAVITNLVLTLPVAKDYQVPGTGAMNTGKIAVAAAAAEKAREIAAEHQNKTDYEKLVAYKNYICGEVSYNHEAVKSNYQGGYGDPWQMIYVFDNNPDTKVVCEGYSKALQYLCDQSGVSCISVGGPFGDEKSPGPHLWNIVTLEGKNYLVDLTNSDKDTCGENGELFLAGNASGSVDTGYSFDVGTGEHAGTVKYAYDPAFVAIWDPANLTLAKENYPVPETPEAGECNHSGSTHSAVTDNRNETHSFTCTLCGNNVTVACSVNANGFCAKGCYEPAANVGDTYQITNAGNLYWFAAYVNSGNRSANAILTDDIVVNTDLSGTNLRNWTPIGRSDSSYTGEFDGDVYTISGLYVSGNANCVGFIGKLNGTVKNLGIKNSYFCGNDYVGGVAGDATYGTVTNCYNEGTVSGNQYVGGVAGQGAVTECYNKGTISGNRYVGGVAGQGAVTDCYNEGSISCSQYAGRDNSRYIGGVIGYGTATDCYNEGSVKGSYYVGGVAGYSYTTVNNCHNKGNVSGIEDVGGVVGCLSSTGTVTNCYNAGTVSGPVATNSIVNLGGLVGRNQGTVTSCYSTGSVSGKESIGGLAGKIENNGTVTNCYSTGSVEGSSPVGGMVGNFVNGTVVSCYSTGSVSGTGKNVGVAVGTITTDATIENCYYQAENETDNIGGTTAKTTAAFASGEVAYLLQGTQSTQVWGQTCGQGLPALAGQKVYYGYVSCVEMIYTNDEEDISQAPLAHSFESYTHNETTHSSTCSVCEYQETRNHNFMDATCNRPAYCSVCNYEKGQVDPENHILEYTVNGSTITASCSANCGYSGTASVSVTGKTYDGSAVTATVSKTGALAGETIGITYYQNGNERIESAINAGTYTAKITLGNATASVDFTITPATPVLSWNDHTVTYTGAPADLPALTITLVNGETFSGDITCSYDGGKPGLPTDVGTYTVTASVAAAGNYTAATKTIQLIIAKAEATVKPIPVQKHFRTYAATNSLDLSGFLPQNRGETTYTLGTVTGNFFVEGTAVTNGVLNYATNVDGTDTAGSIQVNVVMKNYTNVTLTVDVERVELTAETKHQVAKNELTEVPAGLTGTSFNTLEKIKAAQHNELTRLLKEDPKTNVIHYDMKLQFSPDGGNSWVDAAHKDFPAEGIVVTLPYPSGTGKNTHNFAVSHMFTAGDNPGKVETPEVKKTDSGIEFKLTGMSPVSVGWAAKQFNVAVASTSHGKVAASHTNAPAGTQVTIKVTPDSGYRMSTLTVLDNLGNGYILGAVNDDTYVFTMPAANVTVKATFVSNSTAVADTTNPKTGDDFHMAFWGGMMMTTMLGVTALLLNKKKFFQK